MVFKNLLPQQKKAVVIPTDVQKGTPPPQDESSFPVLQGSTSLNLATTKASNISEKFSILLPLYEQSSTLANVNQIKSFKYIVDYHPYGKKAASIYKSFVCNEIEYQEGADDLFKQDWNNFYASLSPQNAGSQSEKDLLDYLVKCILIQGGTCFWVNVDENMQLKLINLPFDTITPIFSKDKAKWMFDSTYINTGSLASLVKASTQQEITNASELQQFMIYFFEADYETMTPIPFFSSALNDCYTETMWRGGLIYKIVEKLAVLKFFQYKVGKGSGDEELGKDMINQVMTIASKIKGIGEGIIDQLNSGLKGIIGLGSTGTTDDVKKRYLLTQANAVTSDHVTIETHSTLETPGHISTIAAEIRKPLAAALRVPSQFLDLSTSRTETQIGTETDVFLESVDEMRMFISRILKDLAIFRSQVQGITLPPDFKIEISESDVAGALKRNQALLEEEEIKTTQLANLQSLKNLGFEVTEEMIKEVGYETTKSAIEATPIQPSPAMNQKPTNKPQPTQPTGGQPQQ